MRTPPPQGAYKDTPYGHDSDFPEPEPPIVMVKMRCCGEWVDDPFMHECLGGGE